MKKTIIIMLVTTITLTLCACGAETTGSISITEAGTEQTVKQNIGTEQTNSERLNTERQSTAEATSEISKSQQTKKESYVELDNVLDEINTEINPGIAGSGMN